MDYSFKKIMVTSGGGKVKYENPTNLPLIGLGYSGAVFSLSSSKCVKIFHNEKDVIVEAKALKIGQNSPVFPKLYEVGKNFIVMEYISGLDLNNYLFTQRSLPNEIAEQLLFCLNELKRLDIPRIDLRLRHLIFTQNNKLKIVDHGDAFRKKVNVPRKLFKNLKKIGLLNDFLKFVKKVDIEVYMEWRE
jgi:predicted Ser/Thr protein kinase